MSSVIAFNLSEIAIYANTRKHGGNNKARQKKATEIVGFKVSQEELEKIEQALDLVKKSHSQEITKSTFLASIVISASCELIRLSEKSHAI